MCTKGFSIIILMVNFYFSVIRTQTHSITGSVLAVAVVVDIVCGIPVNYDTCSPVCVGGVLIASGVMTRGRMSAVFPLPFLIIILNQSSDGPRHSEALTDPPCL